MTTGIGSMIDIPWGTHFCYFYETKQDLLEALVPFFRAGLEHREFCLWVVYKPITEADALGAMRAAMPDLDRYLAENRIAILVHPDLDTPEQDNSLTYLYELLASVSARGLEGLRIAGSPMCLQKMSSDSFREFEWGLGQAAANNRLIALCHFPLADSTATEILDAARSHRFVLARREGDWKIIETAESRRAHAEIARLNEQLERRVEQRTRELEAANEELRKEIARRERVEEDLRKQKEILQTVFDHVPVAINFLDNAGRIRMANREWERMVGHTLEEIERLDLDVIAAGYPERAEQQRARDFLASSTSEWADFESQTKDGATLHTTWAVARLSDGSRIGIGQDITERKKADRELRRQKEILQTIFDHIPVMINFGDANNNAILANREWERTLGWSLEEIVRNNIDILVENYPDPEYRKKARELVAECTGEWTDLKTKVRDGRVLDISWAMVRLPDGTSIGIGHDITRRKQAEEALRESEERFRQFAENIHDLFWIKTADFKRTLYLSPAYQTFSGGPPEHRYRDTDYQPFLNMIHPDDRGRMLEVIEGGLGTAFDIEFRIFRRDGAMRWIHDRGFPIRDASGQVNRVAGVATDITERKLAEEALRESEERFRQLTENIREVFWLRSPDLRQLLYVSPLYEKVCGKPSGKLHSKGVELDVVHPEDRARVVEMLQKFAGQEFEIEYRIVTKDGKVRWLRDRGFPISNQAGEIYRVGGVAEDITERKEAEDRLRATSERLRALSASLQSAREEEATRIAHQIHDDMGGVLTALRWELEALAKMIQEPGEAEQMKAAMQTRLAAMLGLTDTTINVVRRIASELRPSILDDLGLLEAVEWQAEQFQSRTGIECRCECGLQSTALAERQATAVFRIFQEALTNILRHARATRVQVTILEEEGVFVLTVADNGRGITEVEKFSRRSLGILGMQERAHLIGGQLEISGDKGVGTTLRVRVPVE
jgi:PAS domain S-box-containing protein